MTLNLGDQTLHQEALTLAAQFRRCEAALIEILQQIEAQRVFLKLGYGSLYEYAQIELKLSDSVACNFICVARKAKQVPQLQEALLQGEISVSKVRKITSILTKENAQEWIEKAIHLPQRALEREVARVNPRPEQDVIFAYVKENRLNLQMGISEELMQKLIRIQDLLSQKRQAPVSLEEAIEAMTDEYLNRHDPIERAKRRLEKVTDAKENLVEEEVSQNPNVNANSSVARQMKEREPLPLWLKNQIFYKDQGQCSYVHTNGKRCREKRFLAVHHILPVSHGGKNAVNNLTLLCSTHHKLMHYDWYFGRKKTTNQAQLRLLN